MGKIEKQQFDQLFPNMDKWPITQFSEDRSNFAYELVERVMNMYKNYSPNELLDVLEKTSFLENKRVINKPWKVDPKDEKGFWENIRNSLKTQADGGNIELYNHLLHKIASRYVEEILGNFKPKTHVFARKFLYRFFNLLFNKSAIFVNTNSGKLKKKLKLSGHTEEIRSLFDKGTVVLVPTHYSNLDSIFIGYFLDYMGGFPAFSYGAGLNLFNYEIPAYYMNRLGAYKIDRRKNNRIYRATLLEMSSMSLIKGVNSLFFPGGGRTRSGSLETNLKTGLLSSCLHAQIELIKNNNEKKIFIVPVTFGYHFVLEAEDLIEEYLKSEGKSKYIRSKRNKKGVVWHMIKKLFTTESESYVRIGAPMDVLGFSIDENGKSIDSKGDLVNLRGYFEEDGVVENSKQRESVYTKKLAKEISASFHKNNIVLSSQIIAHVAFKILMKKNEGLEVFAVVNLPVSDFSISKNQFYEEVDLLKNKLIQMESDGLLKLEDSFFLSTDELISMGLKNIGIYHRKRPIFLDKQGELYRSENFKLLYYYSNKLETYHLSN